MDTTAVIESVRRDFETDLEKLEQLVRIPSISASPDHTQAVRRCAEATAEQLAHAGFDTVRLLTTQGEHPYVVAAVTADPSAPTVLLYAHHDVQPPGIIDNWTSDPFTPRLQDGRLYGRGTADDKAGIVAHAACVRAWQEAGGLPCNVKVLIEGEEEIGSPNLQSFLETHKDELAADVIVLADAGNWQVGAPGITYLLRGLVGADVSLRALDGPVHSGLAGGLVPDPAMAMSVLLASLVDARGDIAIDGFWDDVRSPHASELARLADLPPGNDHLRRAFGVRPDVHLVGDPEATIYERLWMRPAITITGLDAHPIKGSSNQIVAQAAARLSIRLAPGQNPHAALDKLRAHLQEHAPWGLELTFTRGEAIPAWACEPTGWAFDAAHRALTAGFDSEPVYMGIGGTIPFVGPFAEAFGGIPALLIGAADPTSRIHGEDESVEIDDLRKLVESEVHLLAEVARSRTTRDRS